MNIPLLSPSVTSLAASFADWINDNQGVVGVGIFILTLLIGWVSGIFSALRRKPKFKLKLNPGPSFVCTFPTGDVFNENEVHRVGIALYLSVANCGSAASSIAEVHVGYRWGLRPFSKMWFKHTLFRSWLTERTAALSDFQVAIGKNIKVFPFLFQKNQLSPVHQDTYLRPGQSVVGVVYFEQADSWGACQPWIWQGRTRLAVRLIDVFGGRHTQKFNVPALTLEEARRFNPSFGLTIAELHGRSLPDEGD